MNGPSHEVPPAVLEAFGLDAGPVRRAGSGLINETWHVADGGGGRALVLQRVSRIFPPEINADIDALTRHLRSRGLVTPLVVPTLSGRLWLEHQSGIWRVLTAVDGVTHEAVGDPGQAREAGRILARFHRAVDDFDRPLGSARLGVHDTPAHLAGLERALDEHCQHAQAARVRRLAERIFALARNLPPLPSAAARMVHGDPKVSNILFDRASGRALCLVDLDTLTRMPVALELGDAMRSWCNPQAEDAPQARLSIPLFEAAVHGYAEAARGLLAEREWSAIPAAALTITVELAARFCADALAERYFRFDPQRYPSASAHNQARAAGQLALAESIRAELAPLDAAVQAAFRGSRGP